MLKQLFGIGEKELGRVLIPGEATVELPAGRVKLRYEQERVSVHKNAFRAPEVEVEIVPAGGGAPLELKRPRMVSSSSGKVDAAPVGTVEVEAPGPYRVTVSVSAERSQPVLVLRA